MKVKTIKGVECPHCGEFIEPTDLKNNEAERFQCGECEELHDNEDDAKACCKE